MVGEAGGATATTESTTAELGPERRKTAIPSTLSHPCKRDWLRRKRRQRRFQRASQRGRAWPESTARADHGGGLGFGFSAFCEGKREREGVRTREKGEGVVLELLSTRETKQEVANRRRRAARLLTGGRRKKRKRKFRYPLKFSEITERSFSKENSKKNLVFRAFLQT